VGVGWCLKVIGSYNKPPKTTKYLHITCYLLHWVPVESIPIQHNRKEDVMSYLYLNTEAAELIKARGKTDDKKEALTDKLSKLMPYTAFRASECESPDLHEEVRQAVTASFTQRERTLIAYTRAEAKSLNALQKKDRKTAQQKIGSRCADIYKALKKRQVEPRDTERKAKTLSQKLIPMCETMEKQIVAADQPDIKSVKVSMDLLAAFRASLS